MGTTWHSCTVKESSEAQRETVVIMCVLVQLENNVPSPRRNNQFRMDISKGKNWTWCAGFVIKKKMDDRPALTNMLPERIHWP